MSKRLVLNQRTATEYDGWVVSHCQCISTVVCACCTVYLVGKDSKDGVEERREWSDTLVAVGGSGRVDWTVGMSHSWRSHSRLGINGVVSLGCGLDVTAGSDVDLNERSLNCACVRWDAGKRASAGHLANS